MNHHCALANQHQALVNQHGALANYGSSDFGVIDDGATYFFNKNIWLHLFFFFKSSIFTEKLNEWIPNHFITFKNAFFETEEDYPKNTQRNPLS